MNVRECSRLRKGLLLQLVKPRCRRVVRTGRREGPRVRRRKEDEERRCG
jgi:hypothetical protein